MRGIILAGGSGTRLAPVTRAVNKHCLLVYDKPMILHPIETLLNNGIEDITIVSSHQGVGQLASLLGSGYTYRVQRDVSGIPDALAQAYDGSNQNIVVVLGDNIFLPKPFINDIKPDIKASCFLYQENHIPSLRQLGVATVDSDNRIVGIEEKPEHPKSNLVVTGLYIFSPDVFKVIPTLQKSKRDESEVSDLLNHYILKRELSYNVVKGFWGDAGTFDGILECSDAVSADRKYKR